MVPTARVRLDPLVANLGVAHADAPAAHATTPEARQGVLRGAARLARLLPRPALCLLGLNLPLDPLPQIISHDAPLGQFDAEHRGGWLLHGDTLATLALDLHATMNVDPDVALVSQHG